MRISCSWRPCRHPGCKAHLQLIAARRRTNRRYRDQGNNRQAARGKRYWRNNRGVSGQGPVAVIPSKSRRPAPLHPVQLRHLPNDHVSETTPHLLLGAGIECAPCREDRASVQSLHGRLRAIRIMLPPRLLEFILQSSSRNLPQMALGMEDKRLPAAVSRTLS